MMIPKPVPWATESTVTSKDTLGSGPVHWQALGMATVEWSLAHEVAVVWVVVASG